MTEKLPFKDPLPEIFLAIDAVKKASEKIIEIYIKDFSTSYKNDKEPITKADIKSNQIIENILSSTEYPILSEESIDKMEKRLSSSKVWIVDPLDGTTDLVNKTGEFTIMIALVEYNNPILGVICAPSKNQMYISQIDKGAYSFSESEGWKKLLVSERSELNQCRVVGSRFHQSPIERKFLESLGISEFNSRGSSLKVIDISSGMAELYFTTTDKIKQWDTCASYCLVTEAGGKMTDMAGQTIKYNTKIVNHPNGILVSNGQIHQKIAQKYADFIKS